MGLLQQAMDWEQVTRVALRHRVASLLYQHLCSTGCDSIPVEARSELRKRFELTAQRNLFLAGEQVRVLRLFERRGISAVPFKGPLLAHLLYGNLALRESVDIDVLVHRRDFPAVKELLLGEGFRPQVELSRAEEAAYIETDCELEFKRVSPLGNIFVDVHWALTPRFFSIPLDPGPLWQRLRPTPFGGILVSTFSPEDLLLVLCVHHGAVHLWQRLDTVCDIAQLLRVYDALDWVKVLEEARALGMQRTVFVGLSLAHRLLGAPVPQEALTQARSDPEVETLAAMIEAIIMGEGVLQVEGVRSHFLRLRMRERMGDRLRYCLRLGYVPNKADWDVVSLPRPLFPLYSLIRPVRLAGVYGGVILRRPE